MADLRNRQLQERYQTLITTSNISDASPVVGALQNGQGDALTQVTLGLGSVSAPSYSFTGDEDTGMFSSGANVLNLATGGNKRMTIASGGNISIGTANSSAKLQVGTSSEEILRLERDTTSNDSFIDLTYASGHNNDSDANHEYSKIRTKVVANLSGLESSELHFQTINTGTIGNKMVITKEGNVGIGSAPTSLLQLEQSIVPRITLIKTGVLSWYLGNVLQGSDNNFTIGTDSGGNTNILTLDTSGNVGINGTPSDKLEVAGLSNYTGLTLKGDASSRPALTFKNVNQSLLGSIYGTEGRALAFESGGNGTTGVLAMTIDSSGRIGVGVTPESWTTWTPIQIGQASTFGGRISANQTDVANNWYYDGTEKRINAGYAQRYVQDVNGDHYWMTAGTSTADSTISFNTPMIIKNSGNVGIGTTDPDGTLHLDAGTSSDLVIEKDDGGYASLRFHNAGSQASYIQLDASEDMIHYGGSGVNQIIYAGGSERMRIDSSGIVQARRARSNTAGDVALSLQPSDSTIHYGFRIDSANNFLNIDRVDSAGTIMTLDPSGNVGIGVSPSTALHIDQPSNDRAGGLYLEIDGSNYGLSAFVNSGGYGVIGSNGAFTTDILTMNLSNGNVGIGSSDPDHPLTVTAGPSSAGVPVAWIHNSTNSADHDGTVISSTNDGADAEVLHVRANNTTYSNGTSLMLVRGDGNVGFGTTSPDEPVHVAKSTGDAIIAVEANDGNAALYLTSAGSGKDNRIVSGNAKALKFEVQSAGSGQGQGQDPVATGTTVMTLTNSGNVLVAKTSASRTTVGHEFHSSGFARHTALEDKSLEIVRTSTDGEMVEFFKDSTQVGTIGVTSGSFAIGQTNTGIGFFNGDRIAFPATSAGVAQDNAIDLGYSGARFDDIYATNGTIQTSDVNEKQDIEELSEAELRVAQKAKTLIRKYRWKSSVEEKGDDARIHFGIIAQDLEQAFTDEGLDAGRYGMFIKSTWTNEDGEEQTRLGVRYNQLLAFIISAI